MSRIDKFVVRIFFIITLSSLIGCKPVKIASTNEKVNYDFSCIASQNNCEITTELGDFTVQFSGELAEGKIKTELPLYIRLKFTGAKDSYKLQKADSFMEGTNMFMGKIPVFFEVSSEKNTLIAQTLLASCSEEVMTWRLWFTIDINVDNNIKQQSLFIDFDSKRL